MLDIRPNPDIIRIPGSRVPVLFGSGSIEQLGRRIRDIGGTRVVVVSDTGIRKAGHLDRAMRSLYEANLPTVLFDQVVENPTTRTVIECWRAAHKFPPDIIVGLGGGSSMDTAKGFNFLFTNGGRMQDYQGRNKATQPMLPLVAIPTTTGTGSEAQSYALISDVETHVKMACGDEKTLARLAILDPDLTATQPRAVAAATGIDAITHAIETSACTRRTDASRELSLRAWQLLSGAFTRVMQPQATLDARLDMQLGAHLAGCAIENSMLGAAHAAANPLTAEFGIVHGMAVGLMLPHVIRFNSSAGTNAYSDLHEDATVLADRVTEFLGVAGFPNSLRGHLVPEDALPRLAAAAAKQWTATFNPRPVGETELLQIYRQAW